MRPSPVGDALQLPSRKHSFAGPDVATPIPPPANGAPTTFFLATESMLDDSSSTAVEAGTESSFGVRSLESTLGGTEADDTKEDHRASLSRESSLRKSIRQGKLVKGVENSSDPSGYPSATSSPDKSPAPRIQRRHLPETVSQALTPASLASPTLESSLPSSPKSTSTRSLRLSDEDSAEDGESQVVLSSGDEDGEPPSVSQGIPPQLIMPSITMPSRRPFTERGKHLGRLKVLLAGASGVGKTSLIKSIVQTCEDIVHVDPLSTNPPSVGSVSSKKKKTNSTNARSSSQNQITEVYASTKAYPSWWSDFDESTILRRRKSGGETVLERNVCFVDTPGYDSATSVLAGMDFVLQYIEAQMAKNTSFSSMCDGDLLSMLGGDGGFQVDLVLYLISESLRPTDIEFLTRLSHTTNVIPLLAKADTLSEDDAQKLKSAVSEELEMAGIRSLMLSNEQPTALPLFAVCSSPSNDMEDMDASLLMSSDYVQPLLPSDLSVLVEQIFDKDNASWLRHCAAKKIIRWRKTPRAMSIITPTSRISFTPQYSHGNPSPLTVSTSSTSQALVSYPGSPLSYAQARVADHTQREESLARIHLANWAGSLQRSLQNERAKYEALAREQRTAWLRERLDDCATDARDRSLMSSSQAAALEAKSSKEAYAGFCSRRGLGNPEDPLGLMRWNEAMRQRGWIAFQVVGSFGVLGAVAVWVIRNWGINMGLDGSAGWTPGWLGGVE